MARPERIPKNLFVDINVLNSLLYASDESKTPNVKIEILGERLFFSWIIGWNSEGI